MRLSKVFLGIRGEKEPIQVNPEAHGISLEEGVLKVVVPIDDWWTHTEDYDLRGVGISSKIANEHLAIEFPDEETRKRFHDWLLETFAKAKHGYQTMWP